MSPSGYFDSFFEQYVGPPTNIAKAEPIYSVHLPAPGILVRLSPEFMPAQLQGITIHPDKAHQLDYLIHKSDQELEGDQKKEEYRKLVKYFLASLTIPDEDQWVNLSPYENNRIIKDDFGKTEMGRDLLAEDYLLKQITSSLIYPEDGLGKKFWNEVYDRAWKEYHTTNIPVNTFNKVWIVPEQAYVYESGNTAYILKSHLKVMLEEDYMSLQKHSGTTAKHSSNDSHAIGSQIIREIILPELEKEINEGKNFSSLRQMYSGMVLATWYKKALKESLLGKVYADKARVNGIDQNPKNNEAIYRQYLKAFKKGVFNFIKEDVDKYTNEAIPRKYFSGGFDRAIITTAPDGSTHFTSDVTIIPKGHSLPAGIDAASISLDSLDRASVSLREPAEVAVPVKELPVSVLDQMMMPVGQGFTIGEFERTRDRIDQFRALKKDLAYDLLIELIQKASASNPAFEKNNLIAPGQSWVDLVKIIKWGYYLNNSSKETPRVEKRVTVKVGQYRNGGKYYLYTDQVYHVVSRLEELQTRDPDRFRQFIDSVYRNQGFTLDEKNKTGGQEFAGFFYLNGEHQWLLPVEVLGLILSSTRKDGRSYKIVPPGQAVDKAMSGKRTDCACCELDHVSRAVNITIESKGFRVVTATTLAQLEEIRSANKGKIDLLVINANRISDKSWGDPLNNMLDDSRTNHRKQIPVLAIDAEQHFRI